MPQLSSSLCLSLSPPPSISPSLPLSYALSVDHSMLLNVLIRNNPHHKDLLSLLGTITIICTFLPTLAATLSLLCVHVASIDTSIFVLLQLIGSSSSSHSNVNPAGNHLPKYN